jgi:hypothetical protein
MTRRLMMLTIVLVLVLAASSCLPERCPNVSQPRPGFFRGIWHGIISPFVLIISLFHRMPMYQSGDPGFLYNLGFMLGIAGTFGGGVKVFQRKR